MMVAGAENLGFAPRLLSTPTVLDEGAHSRGTVNY